MIGEPFRQNKKTKALFRCKCGVEKVIDVQSVKGGATKSCGCYNRKAASERMSAANSVNSHGLTEHPLYNSWKSMKTRCLNENSPEYFGANILIYDKWINDFKSFYDWAILSWKENLVLRRKDESVGFNPDNCYFGVRPENSNPEKARETMLERYGVSSPLQLPDVRAKAIETSRKRYGTDYPC